MDRDVLSKTDVQAYLAKNFIPVKLNAENKKDRVKILEHDLSYAEAVSAYGVKGFPATLFLEPNGQLIYNLSGYHPKDKYLEILKFMAERKFEAEQGEGE
ncbi:MAG: thioredoxin family protein [Candidatus Latescibacterota bacterium]